MIQVRAGSIIGRDHMARQANAQDSYAVTQQGNYMIGVVCDGCGSGAHSEVGAKLAAQHITAEARRLLGAGVAPTDAVRALYGSTLRFLDYLTLGVAVSDRAAFVQDYLLFTVVGVIADDTHAVLFSAGDGLLVADAMICEIDQQNAPAYIAYHLVDEVLLGGFQMPDAFEVYATDNWSRLAIATDGFERDLLPDVWGLGNPRALQRKLNVWSNIERRFRDDTTIITLEQVEAEQ